MTDVLHSRHRRSKDLVLAFVVAVQFDRTRLVLQLPANDPNSSLNITDKQLITHDDYTYTYRLHWGEYCNASVCL